MSNFIKIFTVIALSLGAIQAHTQNERKISIQSTLKDISGKAIPDGPQTLTFKLYNEVTGGTALWTEMAEVEVVGGIYSHKLGSIMPLDVSNFGNSNVFLGVTVSGGQELAPRTELTYAPYALAVRSLSGSGKSASFETNGNFRVTGSATFDGGVSCSSINGVGLGRDGGSSQFAGRFYAFDNTHNDIYQPTNFYVNNTRRFYTDQFGSVTQGRHYVGSLNINDTDTGVSGGENNVNLVANGVNRLSVINDRVGINTSVPKAPLHVQQSSYEPYASGDYEGFFWGSQGILQQYDGPPNAPTFGNLAGFFDGAIMATQRIFSAVIQSFSDKRIKNIEGISDSKDDLEVLNKIKITDYTMIDKKNDNGKYKKVIAQDIQVVFPQAISQMRKVVPDLYCFATKSKHEGDLVFITLDKNHQLVKGDKIDLYHKEGLNDELNIEGIVDERTFYIKSDKKLEKIFVYGKYVDDFLSVDYDALSMLNISATQELYKRLVALESENKALKSTTASLEDRMSKIEALLSDSDSTASNTNNNASRQK